MQSVAKTIIVTSSLDWASGNVDILYLMVDLDLESQHINIEHDLFRKFIIDLGIASTYTIIFTSRYMQ